MEILTFLALSSRRTVRLTATSLVLVLSACLAVPAHADYDKGNRALNTGDFATAAREFAAAAENGDGGAALKLGQMREQGQGGTNLVEATYWYLAATREKHVQTTEAAIAAIERLGGVYAPRPVLVQGKKRDAYLTAKQVQEQLAFIDQLARDRIKAAPKDRDYLQNTAHADKALLLGDLQYQAAILSKQPANRDLSDAERQDLEQLAGLLPGSMKRATEESRADADGRDAAVLANTMRIEASEFSTTVGLNGKKYEPMQVPDDSRWASWSLDVGFARDSTAEPMYFLQVMEQYVSNRPRQWTAAATDNARVLDLKTTDRQVVEVLRTGVLVKETTLVRIPADLLGSGRIPPSFKVRLSNSIGQTLTLVVSSSTAMDTWTSAQAATKRYRK